jgi:hypothetical protein
MPGILDPQLEKQSPCKKNRLPTAILLTLLEVDTGIEKSIIISEVVLEINFRYLIILP